MGSTTSPSRRHLGAAVAAVLAVAVVVTGASALSLAGSGSDPAPAPPAAAPAQDPTVDLDRGDATDADVEACASGGFAPDASSVEVLYGVRQQSPDGDVPVLLLRNAAGDLRFCDLAGPDAPAQLPLPGTETDEPVVFLTNGRRSWDCTGRQVQGYTATTWLAVGPEVATVQERYWQDGTPGPWFTTAARGGYAHLQTWLTGPLPEQTRLGVQTRALDADGHPVSQSALPRGRQALPGCAGGDVQIG
jgi:hypothetical protein